MANRADNKRPPSRLSRRTIFIVAAVVTLVVGTGAVLEAAYADKVPPGVNFGGKSLGGLSLSEARTRIDQQLNAFEANGLTLVIGEKDLPLDFVYTDPSGVGLSTDVVVFDAEATYRALVSVGRRGTFLIGGFERLKSLLFGTEVKPRYTLDQDVLRQALDSTIGSYEQPTVEPHFAFNRGGVVEVVAPKPGKVADRNVLMAAAVDRITHLSEAAVEVSLHDQPPAVSMEEASKILPEIRTLVEAGSLTLQAGADDITVKPSKFITWLQAERNGQRQVVTGTDKTVLGRYLKELLPEVSTVAKNAKFAIKDGVVEQIQGSRTGSELDMDASLTTLVRAFPAGERKITLTMREVVPSATAATIGNLGVKELVATGKTNFAGSPVNRRHNIAVGANLLNGLLVKPGEEFSLIKTIGPVDATLGYRQELVIKGNRTIPEFGGGLCQIGTTMFRLVMNTGLPVIERQNHSYRVRYYEPPVGMDATIYEPKPDFRFRNDYGGYLLLQTRIVGDDLIFEFWGTKDGRTVNLTKPRTYNQVSPPAALTIETTEIPVGTTKCIEKAHVGSDAEFTYSVTYSDGRQVDQLFKSHYKPWRQVCLVGVKELSSTTTGETNTNN